MRQPESEVLAPPEATTGPRHDDCGNWHKQHHTVTRVYVRLRDEEGYRGSHSTALHYVRLLKEEMARERERCDSQGHPQLD